MTANSSNHTLDVYQIAALIPVSLMPPIQLIGLVGNGLTIAVFLGRGLRASSVSTLFVALAAADAVVLLSGSLLYAPLGFYEQLKAVPAYRSHIAIMSRFGYPFSNTAQTTAVYTLLLITTERYIAVSDPIKAKALCTRRAAVLGVVFALLGAVAFNSAKFCEFSLAWQSGEGGGAWAAVPWLKHDWYYRTIYTMWLHILVMFALPFLAIIPLNVRIIKAVREARAARERMSRSQAREQQVTLMILAVIAFFCLANSLPFVLAVLEAVVPPSRQLLSNEAMWFLSDLSNLLVQLNSAINFFIYYRFNRAFRVAAQHLKVLRWLRLGSTHGHPPLLAANSTTLNTHHLRLASDNNSEASQAKSSGRGSSEAERLVRGDFQAPHFSAVL